MARTENPTTKASPNGSANTKLDKQSCVTSPSRTNKVPAPADIVEPVNENPRTATPLVLIVKPAASASPPEAPATQPS